MFVEEPTPALRFVERRDNFDTGNRRILQQSWTIREINSGFERQEWRDVPLQSE